MSRSQARSCHSLVLRVPGPVDAAALADRLRAGAADAWPQWATGLRLWEETLPYGAGGPAARDRVAAEAERPLHAEAPPLRAVLLRYADGDADLVLVARRELTFEEPHFTFGRDTGTVERHGDRAEPLEWGLGDPARRGRTGEVRLPGPLPADTTLLTRALLLVLSRYGAGRPLDETRTAREALGDPEAASAGAPALPPGIALHIGAARPGERRLPRLAPAGAAEFHLLRHEGGGVTGTLRHDLGEMSPFVAERLAGHVAHVARQLAEDPDRALDTVETMTADESEAVLRLGVTPPTGAPGAADRTLHGLFADVARERPGAVALTAGDTHLTYAELDERSDRTAAGLAALGVAPGSLVGVALERDADLVVTLLGVLKAGCAYVPMDVRYPRERLRYTVENAGVRLVVGACGLLPGIEGVRVVAPDELSSLAEGAAVPVPSEDAAAAAYVIYTSGSTGRPKGVVVPHRNVAALLEATVQDFGLGADDVWTLFHSSAFDFSVWEIWGCLLTGGRLVVVDYWVTRDTDLFHELLVDQRVTVLNQTPSAFAQIVEADRRRHTALSLRLVVFGGEPLDVRMLAPWFARHSPADCRLVNMFGITETTVHVTAHTVTPADVLAGGRRVGPALPGWTLSVRDPRGRLLPLGVPGEICVGGAGVADRYLGQRELTAERFIDDPYGEGRVYRSGDRGRLRPDGGLDHLGRLDSQVKVRGHRVELDEIRNVLLTHPAVAGAAAVLNHDVPGDAATARIDAYVTLRAAASTADVLSHARGVLPAYMVPASVTELPLIPLTINGKVDTAALPAPRPGPGGAAGEDHAGTAPAGPGEGGAEGLTGRILRIWGHALNTDVTLKDNFFELGGNSLLVIRVLREMREQGLPRVATQDFYRNSTAGRFVELVREAQV